MNRTISAKQRHCGVVACRGSTDLQEALSVSWTLRISQSQQSRTTVIQLVISLQTEHTNSRAEQKIQPFLSLSQYKIVSFENAVLSVSVQLNKSYISFKFLVSYLAKLQSLGAFTCHCQVTNI